MGAVNVISDTIQEYNGERFYLCGQYFQRKGTRLHLKVWTDANGDIPKGYQVHHIDGNRSNNDISNLRLMSAHDHLSYHMQNEGRRAHARRMAETYRPLTKAWHHSEEGKKWHSQNAIEAYKNRELREYKCTYCDKSFLTKYIYSPKSNHFCSGRCKAAFRRMRIKNESQEN